MKLSTTLPIIPLATRLDRKATRMLFLFSPTQLSTWRYKTAMYIAVPSWQSASNNFSKVWKMAVHTRLLPASRKGANTSDEQVNPLDEQGGES